MCQRKPQNCNSPRLFFCCNINRLQHYVHCIPSKKHIAALFVSSDFFHVVLHERTTTVKGEGSRTTRIGLVNRGKKSKSMNKIVIGLFCVLNISIFRIST